MMITIPLSPVQCVYGRDEYNYQVILDNLETAKDIYISTYNFSSKPWKSQLLNRLKKIEANITIITNIPKRFDEYFGRTAEIERQNRKNARDSIRSYLRNLEPSLFRGNVKIYFNYRNHSKVYVLDNSYAYIGSGNFSDESSTNYEVGTIFTSRRYIEPIKEQILDNLCRDSYRIASNDEIEELKYIRGMIEYYIDILEDIGEEFDYDKEKCDNGIEEDYTPVVDYKKMVFDNVVKNIKIMQKCIDIFYSESSDYEELLDKYDNNFLNDIEHLYKMYDDFTDNEVVRKLLSYDKNTILNKYYEDNTLEADDEEKLEALSQKSVEIADEIEREVIEQINRELIDICQGFQERTQRFLHEISRIYNIEGLIDVLINNIENADNTGYID